MRQACAEWHGEIGAHVVGALSPAEASRMRRHLRRCAGCRADYRDLAPVRDWLERLGPGDGMPARPPLARLSPEPGRPLRHIVSRRRWAAAGAAIAAAVIAVIAVLSAHPAGPGFRAVNSATGVRGQRCILVTVSPAGTAIAGTWTAQYSGTAEIIGTSAIPRGQLTALRIEAPSHRLLLNIPI